ncbi:MAG: phosphoribosylformylglycinamidine synthase subunit PurL [Thermomicrobiales bacterium]|nr:phosphoribosylformylglycinamidine synthase subunit PurL [Thermomicrobiales bacterium]
MAIAEGQWRDVALSDHEYAQIVELLGREPSEVELGMFGAMWSEHCGYKHSRPLLKGLPTEAPWVVQGPGENAGAVDLGNGYAAVFKVESHNHPSAVEPYEGAATGVGGIVRDIFTMGARPVAILDGLRFGPLDVPRNSYLYSHVVAGIGGYGNCLGVPTVGGEVFFDASYNGNPLVNAMCVGIAPVDGIVRAAASGVGNVLMLIGADTGRDGLHGATFSSVDDPEASHRGVIQVGNPFLEKQLMEACLELLSQGSVVAMQDLGAAGMTSSIVECASRGDVGVDIDVALVPRREDGMNAYEIMLSESQERMVLVATPDRVAEITDVLNKWSLNASVIGRVTDTGNVVVRDGKDVVCDVPVRNFIDDCPVYPIDPGTPAYLETVQQLDLDTIPDIDASAVGSTLLRMLESPNLGSRRGIWEQYDHTILTNTVLGPGQADAAVIRQKGTRGGMAISLDCNSRYVYLDPYLGAQHAVAEAARNVAATGARPLGLTNCLNFGSPERNPADYQLVKAVKGMGDASRKLGVPIVSGNVSLYNETQQQPVFPTPAIGCVGVLEDVTTAMDMRWQDGETVWLVGQGQPSLGGSEYLAYIHGMTAGRPPAIDLDAEVRLIRFLHAVASARLDAAVHDLSAGGFALGIVEMALTSGIGVTLADIDTADRIDTTWFGESAGRVLIAVDASATMQLRRLAEEWELPHQQIGVVGGDAVVLPDGTSVKLSDALAASESALSVGVEAEMA